MRIGRTNKQRVALIAAWAAMAPAWAGQGGSLEPVAGDQAVNVRHRVSPTLTLGPVKAARAGSDTRVTIVASHNLGDAERSVHALIEQPGDMVRWVSLPLKELPEGAFVVGRDRFVCLDAATNEDQKLRAFDVDGRFLAEHSLAELLPQGTQRTPDPLALVATPDTARLSVFLQCGTVALIDVAQPESLGSPDASPFHVCSVVLSDKHSCGIDAWLDQARKLDREGDEEATKYALEAAIETAPEDARGYRELARFYRQRDNGKSEIECLQAGVLRLHSNVTGSACDRWQVGTPAARLTVDYIHAVHEENGANIDSEALSTGLELYPCMEELVLLQAKLLMDEGQNDAAIKSLEYALARLDPNADLAAAYHDVGRFLLRRKQPKAALRFLEDAFALGDKTEFLLRGLADAELKMGQPGRAVDWLSLLATRWRSANTKENGVIRAQRAAERLANLEEEITVLLAAAAEPAE